MKTDSLDQIARAAKRLPCIPYGQHWLEEDDVEAVLEVLRSDRLTQGPWSERFEQALAQYVGVRHAVVVSSGTAALHLASASLEPEPNFEAIVPALTFVATPNSAVYCGGVPRLTDIDPHTLNLDPERVEASITERTQHLMPVHFAGLAADMPKLADIARRHNLRIIEDACHALGTVYATPGVAHEADRVGNCRHADLAVLSFHPVKAIAAGEGGAVLTNNAALAGRVRRLREHGLERDRACLPDSLRVPWGYAMEELGFNYRITDLQCALGLTQLRKLPRFIMRRREIALTYCEAFGETEDLMDVPSPLQIQRSANHIFPVQIRLENIRLSRGEIFDRLRAEGLGVQVHYIPVHHHPFYQWRFGYRPGQFPATEKYYERALSLPLFPKMTDAEVERVIETVLRVLREAASREKTFAARG